MVKQRRFGYTIATTLLLTTVTACQPAQPQAQEQPTPAAPTSIRRVPTTSPTPPTNATATRAPVSGKTAVKPPSGTSRSGAPAPKPSPTRTGADDHDVGLILINEGLAAAWWPRTAATPERGPGYQLAQQHAQESSS